ncbi:TPA: zinc finger protein 75-like [Bos taurus]|nr:TPA: zinc finger protein 75-like [Bos taurus]
MSVRKRPAGPAHPRVSPGCRKKGQFRSPSLGLTGVLAAPRRRLSPASIRDLGPPDSPRVLRPDYCRIAFQQPVAFSTGKFAWLGPVTTHQLGNDTALLGGTAVAPGFKWKPAEPQPMGVFQEECSNIYQVLQEPRWNTHKESQPVDKGAVPAEESPTFSEEKSTPSWKLTSKLTLPKSQSPLTFEDVALYFSEEEWRIMTPEQKTLYFDVMGELYEDVTFLGLGPSFLIAHPATATVEYKEDTEFKILPI